MSPDRMAQVARALGHRFSFSEGWKPGTYVLTCDGCGKEARGNRGQINKFATTHVSEIADEALYNAGWEHVSLEQYLNERQHALPA